MSKEKKEKDLVVRVYPSLFDQFKQKCELNYKSVSEVVRDLMSSYIKGKND
jgi:hypothetical protein